MKARNSFLILLCILFFSCATKEFDTAEEITTYIKDEDHKLHYKKTVNGVDYTLQYRPTDVMIAHELGDNQDPEEIKRLRTKYSKQMYFNLSMSINNEELLNSMVNDQSKFTTMVSELAFNMDQKVNLYTPQKDTLSLIDFVYPRMYGTTKATTILLVYPRNEKILKAPILNFTIEDLGLFTGEVKFKIDTKSIKNEPTLNF